MLLLTMLCGVAVGVSLGLTGGGGSILAVPLLIYGLGVQPQSAVSVSLAAVGATSLAGAVQRSLHGLVEFKTGLLFAASGVLGVPLGTWIGTQLPAPLLLMLFAGLMLMVATRMWMKATRAPAEVIELTRAANEITAAPPIGPACRRDAQGRLPLNSRCTAVLLSSGIATGVLSGLFGVGGGFVIVPALVLITSLDIRRAVGTSLFVMALISGAGLITHLIAGRAVPLEIVVPFAVGGVAGLGLGIWGSHRLSPVLLQKVFAAVIVAVAVYVISRSIS